MPVELTNIRDFSLDSARIDPKILERLREFPSPTRNLGQMLESARQRIMARWLTEKGPASPVGLPSKAEFPAYIRDGRVHVNFRGGRMSTALSGSTDVRIEPSNRVRVTFEGYGLDVRQEKGDELYGTLLANLGSLGYTKSWNLPQVTLGPDANDRVYNNGIVLYEGPPADLNVVFQIVEHDHGDRDRIRAEVQRRVREVFDTGMSLAGGAAGGAVGSALTSLRSEGGAAQSLYGWLVSTFGGVVSDWLGLGDDPYKPGGITISANEMINIPAQRTYKCSADPRLLPYTHRMAVSGRDEGGDVGWVSALFRVQRI